MTENQNDPGLVMAVCAGDTRARDRLIDRWLPEVLRWCIRLGGPRVDAEDAAHDVFVVALGRLDSLREPDRFGSWLFGITRRVLARYRRQAWVRRWVPGFLPVAIETGPSPATRVERSETSRIVHEILERIPPRQREVLVLCDLEDRSDAEVAVLLDVPAGTVKSRLRLGRRRFRLLAEEMSLLDGMPTGTPEERGDEALP
ncbi:MAG: sigma-70 family RNA polymerase sigma factor [Deltaproteobacteria bacterium]|nr:sigma-70 family RNA polymerase sigma factor [Deltaproteobacteria bacterium]